MKIKSRKILPVYAAIAGDVAGSWLEDKYEWLLTYKDYPLFCEKCFPTDDSVFTIAIAESLLSLDISPERIVKCLQRWGRKYPDAGFGSGTKRWIFSDNPQPYGSNRNGGAMRVSPCAVVARTLDEALELAALTCNVSHNTPEGVAGAQAIAAAIFLALEGKRKEEIKEYVENKFGYDLDTSIEYQKEHYAGFSCKASDTVPQAIRCFIECTDVESAIRLGISLGSDADTLASMAAAIAAAYYGKIPFLDDLLPFIPFDMKMVLNKLEEKLVYPDLLDRAQRYSALLCTAIDIFGSQYDGQKFFNATTAKKWILASLPEEFYSFKEKMIMNGLLEVTLYHWDIYTLDYKMLKERYSDIEYICDLLPRIDEKVEEQIPYYTDEDKKKMQKEEETRRQGKPRMTTKTIPHYRYEESMYCMGRCLGANHVHDYDEYVEVLA